MKTKHAYKVVLAVALVVLMIGYSVLAIYGADEGTSSGTATVGNATPTVTSLDIFNQAESASVNDTNLVVSTEYRINCTLTDENQLADLVNATFYIWDNGTASWNSANDVGHHYTFKYDEDSDVWSEIDLSGHLVSGSCEDPADHTATSGEFKLAFKLGKWANYTATKDWLANCTVYDDSDASGNQQSIVFGVTFYAEITVNDASHAWSNLSPGQNDVLITSPADNDIDVSVTANANFDLQAKGDGPLTSGANIIGLDNVTIHKDTLGSSVSLTTSFADIGGLTNLESGETAQSHSFKLWIDVPSGQPDGDYTYTLTVKVIQA